MYKHLSQCPRDIRRLPRSSRGCPWLGSPATSSSDGLPLRPRAAPRRAHGPLLPHDGLGRGRRRRCPGDHGARLAPGSVASRSALRCAPGSPASPRACASTRWPIARGGCARSSWRAPARSTIPSPSCREGAGSSPSPMRWRCRPTPTRSSASRCARASVSPSLRPCSSCRQSSGLRCCSPTCSGGLPRRWPIRSTHRSLRSTARSSAPGPSSAVSATCPKGLPRSRPRSRRCSTATWKRSSATTSTRSCASCTRMRRSRCRPTSSGSEDTRTSAGGCSDGGSSAEAHGWCRPGLRARPLSASIGRPDPGRSSCSSCAAIASPP